MHNATFRRTVFLLLLLTILAAPWASAAEAPAEDPRVEAAASTQLLGRFWGFLKSAWGETGCRLDPDGGCAPAPQPQTDEGCHLDPNGGCGA